MTETNLVGDSVLTRAEGLAAGRAVRERMPRAALATIETSGRDPLGILDRQNSTRQPDLIALRTERMAANGRSPWRLHLGFDLLVALSVALATQSIGVMATFCLVFFPPWVAFRIAASWKRALVHCAGISVTAYLAAFVVAILFDQPFGPVLVGTLVAFGLVRLPFRPKR